MTAIPGAGAPTILLDMDEVLTEWVGGLVNRFEQRYPHLSCVPTAERYEYDTSTYHRTPEQRAAMDQIINEPGFFASLEPTPGSVSAVREMQKAGYDVRVCTKPMLTNPTCASEKLDWLRRVHGSDLAYAATITSDKTLQIGDVLIDDHPNILGRNPRPVWTQLRYTRPHNLDLSGHRFNDWGDWEWVVAAVLADREDDDIEWWGIASTSAGLVDAVADRAPGWFVTREAAEKQLDAHRGTSDAPAVLVHRVGERTTILSIEQVAIS